MESKNLIIICIITIIAVASISYAVIATSQNDTSIRINVNSPFYKNDVIKITLTDNEGNELANKTITLSFTDKNKKTITKNVTTNDKGIAKYKVKLKKGAYSVLGIFSGDEDYKSSNFTYQLKVKEKEVKKSSTKKSSSSNNKSHSNSYYNDNSNLDNTPGLEKIYDPETGEVYYHDEYMEDEGMEYL